MVDPVKNPTDAELARLFSASKHNAAKWVRSPDGDVYYWPVDSRFHADVAKSLGFDIVEKGIAVPD